MLNASSPHFDPDRTHHRRHARSTNEVMIWGEIQTCWKPVPYGWTNELVDCYRAGDAGADRLWNMFCLPDFSVVVWLRKTEGFAAIKGELLGAAVTEPYESTEYQGMVDFHWSAANFSEAKRLAEALRGVARHPELVLLRIMSRVDSVDSVSIKDERRTKH